MTMKNIFTLIFLFIFANFSYSQCPPLPCNDEWHVKGNLGTNPLLNNFVGTVDSVNLSFRTYNLERMYITGNGMFVTKKKGEILNPVTISSLNPNVGIYVLYSSWAGGTLNISAFKEKGRTFKIINYSGANVLVSDPVRNGNLTTTTVIGNAQRWEVAWDGTQFLLLNLN